MDALKAFLVRVCPGVDPRNIYRDFPAASPSPFPGPSIVISPVQGGPPTYTSPMGEESIWKQRQRVQLLIQQAAVGSWSVHLLGQTATYVAGNGDTAASIRDGLRAAIDALGLPVTTSSLTVQNAPAVQILADVASVSMTVNQLEVGDIPPGGQSTILMIDDSLRRASYNWGIWTVRLVFRDAPPAGPGLPGAQIVASKLAERVRGSLQGQFKLPVTNGLAYPYQSDLLEQAPARISWRRTLGPVSFPELENGVWMRVVALDTEWDVPCGLVADIPSLDAIGPGTLMLG